MSMIKCKIPKPPPPEDRVDYTYRSNGNGHWLLALMLMLISLCIGIVSDAKRNFIGLEFFVFLSFAIFLFAIFILIKYKNHDHQWQYNRFGYPKTYRQCSICHKSQSRNFDEVNFEDCENRNIYLTTNESPTDRP